MRPQLHGVGDKRAQSFVHLFVKCVGNLVFRLMLRGKEKMSGKLEGDSNVEITELEGDMSDGILL